MTFLSIQSSLKKCDTLTSYRENIQNLRHLLILLGCHHKLTKTHSLHGEILLKKQTGFYYLGKRFNSHPESVPYREESREEASPPCFFSLFLPSSLISMSCSKRDNFLFSRTPLPWADSKGSEDTRFKPSSLAGTAAVLMACADRARFKLPVTGSGAPSGRSVYRTHEQRWGEALLHLLFLPKRNMEARS